MIKVILEYNGVNGEPNATMAEGSIQICGNIVRSEIIGAAVVIVAAHHIQDQNFAELITGNHKEEVEEVIETIIGQANGWTQGGHNNHEKSDFNKLCR